MPPETLDRKYLRLGKVAALGVSVLGILYAAVTTLGLLSLKTPLSPIDDPFFTIIEVLTLLIAPLMAVSITGLHFWASQADKIYSFIAAFFLFIMTCITSSVHFVILVFNHQVSSKQLSYLSLFLSFNWPSVSYVLDVLAWDWFYALSMLFAASVFRDGKLERLVRLLMMLSGVFSLVGLIGVPLQHMGVRNIGIIGYSIFGPVAFLLLSKVFERRLQSGHK